MMTRITLTFLLLAGLHLDGDVAAQDTQRATTGEFKMRPNRDT